MEVKPRYKQTEVGVIPEEWEVKSLGQMAELTSSKRIFESDYVPFGIPFYRGKEISMLVEGEVIDDVCYISEARFAAIKARFGAPVRGDILITAVGTLANVYVVDSDDPFYFKDGNLIWLRGIKDVEAPFLGIQLRRARSAILDGAIGTSQKALTIVVLRNVTVAIPPLPEQRAIATALSDVDGLLGGLDRLIAKKRDLKQAAMQQLLTGQTRLPGFHGEWEVKRLDALADIRSGGTPSTGEPRFWDGDIPWCTPTDITALNGHKYLGETARMITQLGLKSSSAEMIPAHSIVMTSRATIGECAINTVPVSTNQGFKNFVPFMTTDVDFLYYLLTTQKQGFISLCGGSTFLEIGKTQLVAYQVLLPGSKAEQIAIAEVLTEMDGELAALEQRRKKTRALKQAMMQELLTGRTRLV
jgi:type I restriction enzyme S subunit